MYYSYVNDSDGGQAGLLPLLHAAGTAQGYLEDRLTGLGLSLPKLAALRVLSEAGEALPLGQLAERLSCVKSNITQLVDRLEADGFVTREQDPNDRRARLAVLTVKGHKAFEEGTRVQQQTDKDLFGSLSPEEGRQLASLLLKVQRQTGG